MMDSILLSAGKRSANMYLVPAVNRGNTQANRGYMSIRKASDYFFFICYSKLN